MKKAYIISHSHWDREWYLPYEKHHMLFIELMDTLIDTLNKDPEYKSFHLDGQTILLDDYLQVRPEKKEELGRLIQEGKIVIGPWYVLQDEFLTSSEANLRNLQVGHEDAKEYGQISKLGYFPDSFGNMGQAPQILKQAKIDTAVFGRGVKPTGFNNEVRESENFESPYSEMYWESPDGSRVLGILFANWYSNGNEIPVDPEEAKLFWEQKLQDAKRYASTNHLLYMNGCDHQPVQTDLSLALSTARELYPDMEFIHGTFEKYIQSLKEDLPLDLAVVRGELRSQNTDGWFTLANTASTRIYLKQMNQRTQTLFEKIAEPLAAMAHYHGKAYPHHIFLYGWKTLMQNHPHDSICGCSIDQVHREMVTRFEKATDVGQYIVEESMNYLGSKIDTSIFKKGEEWVFPFVVVNSTGWKRSGVVTVELEIVKKYFKDGPIGKSYRELRGMEFPEFQVIDSQGNVVTATIETQDVEFDYELPKDKFRQPYLCKKVIVTMPVKEIPSFGWETYALIRGENKNERKTSLFTSSRSIENEFFIVEVKEDGSLTVTDKQTESIFTDLCIYEDTGDIGNEYIYSQPKNDIPFTTKNSQAEILVKEDTAYRAILEIKHRITIPAQADERLDEEIQSLVGFYNRKAERSQELIPLELTTLVTVEKEGRGIKVQTSFTNNAKDHRLRVLFPTDIETPFHYADSIFEVAQRDNVPSEQWENPCNAQHQQAFINIHDEKRGITIANKGLNEYEVLRDERNTVAITLLRGVRELGDWGVFLTPEAQCLGDHVVEFEIIPHGAGSCLHDSYVEAYQYQIPWTIKQLEIQSGDLTPSYSFLSFTGEGVAHSALKVAKESNDIISRWYNLSLEEKSISIKGPFSLYRSTVLEEKTEDEVEKEISLGAAEIVTLGLKKV